jgi:hypothetical protein
VSDEPLPVVTSGEEVRQNVSTYVVVEGVYEQQDVRMRPPTPEPLYEGHVALVLDDGTKVYLNKQQDPEARRSAEERERFEHRRVRVTGLLFATNPGPGTVIDAPLLADISAIEPAG